jgi:hypothetical protein
MRVRTAVFEEYGQKVFAHDDQSQRRHPFVGRDPQADHVPGTGHSDDLFRGNIRGDERGADGPPRQRPPGEKIILRILAMRALFARYPLGQGKDRHGIDRDDGNVEGGE